MLRKNLILFENSHRANRRTNSRISGSTLWFILWSLKKGSSFLKF